MSLEDALKIIDEKISKKKEKQNKEINVADIIDSEIKGNSIRQGFSKGIQAYSRRFDKLIIKII